MTANFSNDTPQVFDLAGNLLALYADAQARHIPFHQRGATDAQWVVGIKPVSDAGTVHADHWERHPHGDEILCLLEGRVEIILSNDNAAERSVLLNAGQAFIVPRGSWHRLRVEQAGQLMFLTPSQGSEHRRVSAADGEA